RRADRRVPRGNARGLATDRSHAGEALRSRSQRSVPASGRRCGALSRHRARRVRAPGMSLLRILKPGLLTTVQDRGRWGLQSRGVPVSGPMDERAHRIANALIGNPADAATLEVTLLGP